MVKGRGEIYIQCISSAPDIKGRMSPHYSSFIDVIDPQTLVRHRTNLFQSSFLLIVRQLTKMVATHPDINAPPSVLQAVDQADGRKPSPNIVLSGLEQVVADLVKKALSNQATWLGGLPATPNFPFGPSTPPLDADELGNQLIKATDTGSEADCTDIEDGPSPGITEAREAKFKKVLEMYVTVFAHNYQGLLTVE